MFAYILKRILLMIPTLLGVLLLTFVVIQFVPGGPVEQYLAEAKAGAGHGAEGASMSYRGGQGVDPKRLEEIKALYGFDKPPVERFVQMLGQFARFDLGTSFFQNKSVWALVKEKLPVSISLGCGRFSSAIWWLCRWRGQGCAAGSRFDLATTIVILIGYAIPGFVLGVALLVIFGGQLQWFPLRGLTSANFDELGTMGKVADYLAYRAACDGHGGGQLCRDGHADQELVSRGDPQAICADGPRQGLVRAPGALQACVSQCADSHRHGLSLGFHRRLLCRRAADRDPVLARRPGSAQL
jgi:ABC-type microcin C transport system permease subunit YejB